MKIYAKQDKRIKFQIARFKISSFQIKRCKETTFLYNSRDKLLLAYFS